MMMLVMNLNGIDIDENEDDGDSDNKEEVEDEGTVLEIGQASTEARRLFSMDVTFGVSFISISLLINHCPLPRQTILMFLDTCLTFVILSFSEPCLISFRFTTYMHLFHSCISDVFDLPRDAEVRYFLLDLICAFTHVALEPLSVSVQMTRENSTFLSH